MTTKESQAPTVTWRTVLKSILRDHPEELGRLTELLEVNEVSIKRWTRNATTPHYSKLVALFHALPSYQERLLPLIRAEFPHFLAAEAPVEGGCPASLEIPGEFYALAFRLQRERPDRFWSLCGVILEKALSQL